MLIRTAEEITSDGLAAGLGRPQLELSSVDPIGTGQMSQSYRVAFGDESVVVKRFFPAG